MDTDILNGKFDDVLVEIGEFGKYQKIIYLLLCIPPISCGMVMVMSALILGVPNYRCKIPDLSNDTYHSQGTSHDLLISSFIPPSTDETKSYDGCHLYSYNGSATKFDNSSRPINASLVKCDSWVYDQSIFTETFASQHNLVCDEGYKSSVAKTIFFLGVFAGAFIFGYISDIWGRKVTAYMSYILMLLSALAVAFAPNYAAFVSLRFVVGAAASGVFVPGFVIGMEIVGPSKRVYAGVIYHYFFALGLITLAVVGYFVRSWKYIEIITACPIAFYLLYWWLLPESPRWLISKGRHEQAKNILQKAAEVNKKILSEKSLKMKYETRVNEDSDERENKKDKVWHLFTHRTLLARTLIVFFNWMIVSMAYYGLSLNTGNLGGNFYLNFSISGLVEIPAYTLTLLLLDRLGRKILHCTSMIIGGVACLSTVFTIMYGSEDLRPLTITLAMIGKVGASAGFAVIYTFSAELFPTSVRNAGMGLSSCAARIGAMVAPEIADSAKVIGGHIGQATPLVVFGSASVLAGLLTLLLPETMDKTLPETIENAKTFGTRQNEKRKEKFGDKESTAADIKDETKF